MKGIDPWIDMLHCIYMYGNCMLCTVVYIIHNMASIVYTVIELLWSINLIIGFFHFSTLRDSASRHALQLDCEIILFAYLFLNGCEFCSIALSIINIYIRIDNYVYVIFVIMIFIYACNIVRMTITQAPKRTPVGDSGVYGVTTCSMRRCVVRLSFK